MRTAAAVGLVVLGCTLVTIRGSFGGGQDEEIVYVSTASLVRHGSLALPPPALAEIAAHTTIWRDAVAPARDGRWYAVYGPAQTILAAPLYLLGRLAAGGEAPGPQRTTVVRWICAFNPLLTALTAALLTAWLLALAQPRGVAVGGGLLFGLATMAWPYAKTFLSEPLSAACYLAAAAAVWQAARSARPAWAAVAGLALAAGILTRPHNVILAPLCLLAAAAPGARRAGRVAACGLPVAAAVGWWVAFNLYRFGCATDFGYQAGIQHDFSVWNVPRGLWGQLVSPGRGLVWYAPPALLAVAGWGQLRRTEPGAAWLLLAAVAVQGAFYSLRSTWWGNWCWGPRYFVPVLPLLLVLAAPALATPGGRRWAVPLAVLGTVNAWAGLVVYNGLYQDAIYNLPHGLDRLLWEPYYSPLVGHWRYAAQGYLDLMVLRAMQVDPAFGVAALLVRGWPAVLGGWWLAQGASAQAGLSLGEADGVRSHGSASQAEGD